MLFMHDLLHEVKGASDTLQSPKLNFLEAAYLIESLIEELETYQKSIDYFENSLLMAKENNLSCCSNQSAPLSTVPDNLDDFVHRQT